MQCYWFPEYNPLERTKKMRDFEFSRLGRYEKKHLEINVFNHNIQNAFYVRYLNMYL